MGSEAPALSEISTSSESSPSSAAATIRKQGYYILPDVVSTAHLSTLRDELDRQLPEARKNASARGGWLLQPMPRAASFVFADIVANPRVCEITAAVLGPMMFNNLYCCNVNLPGSAAQPVHADAGPLWPEFEYPHPAYTLVVNIPLVELNEVTGSTELWPGTHLDPRPGLWIEAERYEARRSQVPPVRANMKLGSVLIRDIRLWHRGMPNLSRAARHMVTMNHNVFWLERGPPIQFDSGSEHAFESRYLKTNTQFIQ